MLNSMFVAVAPAERGVRKKKEVTMKATARCLKENEVNVSKKMIILIVISLCLLSNCFIITCANIVQASEKIFFCAYPKGEYKPEIYAINTDGTNEIQLFDNDYYRAFPSVSKDGSKPVSYTHLTLPTKRIV